MNAINCLNCGAVLTENYCSRCGQKKTDSKDHSLKTFFTYFFNEFFNWDSKFYNSVKYVLFKPGFLTEEYSKGKHARYVTPLKLYLCMSLVSFLIMVKVDSDQYTLYMANNEAGQNIFANWITDIRRSRNIPEESFKERFNNEINNKQPIYLLLMILMFSLPLKIVESKKFYVDHLAFSFHFFTFALFCYTIAAFLILINDMFMWIFYFIIPFIYLLFAFKRFYRQNWIITVFETGIFSVYYTVLLCAATTISVLVTSLMI